MPKQAMSPIERAQANIDGMMGTEAEPVVAVVEDPNQVVVEPKVETAPIVQAAPEPSIKETTVSEETWEQKYKSAVGMFRDKQGQIESLSGQVTDLTKLVEQLQAQPVGDASSSLDNKLSSGSMTGELATHLTELQDEFGEKFFDVIKALMRSEAKDQIDARVAPVEQKVERNNKTQEEMKRINFQSGLSSRHPDWQEVFDSADFDVFLASNREELSGRPYADIFADANKSWNLDGMCKFFDLYKQANGTATTTQQNQNTNADPRAGLVSPGASNASSNVTPAPEANQRIFSHAEVKAFYKDVQLGKYQGREEEMGQLDREIFQANMEDRIR
jgi:hypothetical protein